MTPSPSKTVRTMCPMSCHPTLCGMLAEVRDGKLVGVKGDEENPDSRGFLCIRGQATPEIFDNPARLLHPLVRDKRNDEFRRASWDEALERAAAGFRASVDAHGGTSVGLFSCSKTTNEMNFMAQKFARVVIGTNNIDSCNRT
jgi:predicted molibdopterin-dependent oxidoreductase YjgC